MKTTHSGTRPFYRLFVDAWNGFSQDNVMRLSAALSYYAIFSIAPLLLIAVGIVGWFYGQKAAEGQVAAQLSQFVGSQTAEAVQSILLSASKHSSGATIVGFCTLLVGASTVFGQLKETLNIIWKVRAKKGLGIRVFIRERLTTFGLVLALGFLLLISLAVSTATAALIGWLEHRFGIPKILSISAGFIAPLAIEVFLFAMMFKILPDVEIPWKSVWVGAGFTAVLFEIGKIGLSFYLGKGSATSSFGAAGSVVLLLLWVYYASCILFYGAEFTEVYARAQGLDLKPAPIAERTAVWTGDGWMPVECADDVKGAATPGSGMSGALAMARPSKPPVPTPHKESLAMLGLKREEPQVIEIIPLAEPSSPTTLREWVDKANEHPAAEVGAALGVGLLAGVLMRLGKRRPAVTASEHFRLGSEAALASALATLIGFGKKIRKRVDTDEIIESAREAGHKVSDFAKTAPAHVRSVLR